MELERIELSPSRLKVERLTIRPQFQKLERPVGIEQLPDGPAHRTLVAVVRRLRRNRLLILMSFDRMVLALGVVPSPCSNLERRGL